MTPFTESEAKAQHAELSARRSHLELALQDPRPVPLTEVDEDAIRGMLRTVKLRIHLLENMYHI